MDLCRGLEQGGQYQGVLNRDSGQGVSIKYQGFVQGLGTRGQYQGFVYRLETRWSVSEACTGDCNKGSVHQGLYRGLE